MRQVRREVAWLPSIARASVGAAAMKHVDEQIVFASNRCPELPNASLVRTGTVFGVSPQIDHVRVRIMQKLRFSIASFSITLVGLDQK